MGMSKVIKINTSTPILKSFARAQVANTVATLVDFLTTILIKELFHVWYAFATTSGALLGAVTGFLFGRYWVFRSISRSRHVQAFRYLIVAIGSLLLNSCGVYILTESTGINYLYSKMVIGIIVGVGFNFVLQRKYVFI